MNSRRKDKMVLSFGGRGIIKEGLYPLFKTSENSRISRHNGKHLAIFDFRGLKGKSKSLDSMRAIVRTLPVFERNKYGGNYMLRLEGDEKPRIHCLLEGDTEYEDEQINEFLGLNEKVYTDYWNNPPEIESKKGYRDGRYSNLFIRSFIDFDDFKSYLEEEEFPDEIFHEKKDMDRYDYDKKFRKWKIHARHSILNDLRALALEFKPPYENAHARHEIGTSRGAEDYISEIEKEQGWSEGNFPGMDRLDIPAYVVNSLYGAGIRTLRDLVMHTENELLGVEGFGKKSLDWVKHALETEGLCLRPQRAKK